MTELPDVKLRALVNFPPNVIGRTAINVVKVAGQWYIDLDYSGLVYNSNITAEEVAQSRVAVWNSVTEAYETVPWALIAGTGVASIDGQTGALEIGNGLEFTGDTLEAAVGVGLDFSAGEIVADIATEDEVIEGTSNEVLLTPLRAAQIMVRNITRALPSGYTDVGVRPMIVRSGAGPGLITLTHTPQSYAAHRHLQLSTVSSVVYVDDEYGDDGDDGSSATPFKTLDFAATESEAQIIRVRAGIYAPPSMSVSDTAYASPGRYLKQFFLDPGVVIAMPGPRLKDQTWTLHSGTDGVDAIYKTTLTLTGAQTVQRVVRLDLFDPVANQPVPQRQYADVGTLTASGTAGWAIATTSGNKVIYVRLASAPSVETYKSILKAYYTDINAEAQWKIDGVPVLIQAAPGGGLFDGVRIYSTDLSGSAGELYADGLFTRFALAAAIELNGGTNFLARCRGHASIADIFNHNAGEDAGANAYVFEHDLIGTNSGDIASQGTSITGNRNGSSAHDDVQVARFGCHFENNWGPQIADIANAETGTSWNIGVICGPTTESQEIGFFNSDAGRTSYYDNCYAYGNDTAISAGSGTAKASNCLFDGATVGTVLEYDPSET